MKKQLKIAVAIISLIFLSCESENVSVKDQTQGSIVQATASQDAVTQRTDSRDMSYGDVVTLWYAKTNKFFTGESNGDATLNKQWNTISPWLNDVWLPYAKFRLINPNNVNSTALVKSGDEIAFKSITNNYYITAESWDDDVSVNRLVLGGWEKWKIYKPSNVNIGETFFYSSTGYMAPVSLKSTWGKYLGADNAGFAKANGAFNATISVWDNPNTFILSKQ